MLRRAEVPLALALGAIAASWAWQGQTFQVFRYWDADEYFLMAQQLAAGETVTAAAPYAYRQMVPWLVATCCSDIQQGFLLLNVASGLVLAALLVFWLRPFIDSAAIRLLMVAAFVLQWHAPLRFAFYYPAYIDPLFQVFLIGALIVGERVTGQGTLIAGAAYTALVAAGTYTRETMLVVPVCAIAGSLIARRTEWRHLGWPALALAAGIAAFLAARLNTDPRGGYRFVEAVALHLLNKPVESLALVWFIAFGPVLAVVLFDWRATLAWLSRRADLAMVPMALFALSYIGGHDTERYLFWAMPVVYLLIAQSLERHWRLVSAPAIAGLLVVTQLVSERVFWPVPSPGNAVAPLADAVGLPAQVYAVLNRVFVIDDFHWNLWSNFGSRPFHLVQLAFYLSVSAAIVLMLQRQTRRGAVA